METNVGDFKVQIDTNVLYTKSYLNSACINLFHKLQRFVVDESDRSVTCIGLYNAPPLPVPQIYLDLFTYHPSPEHLSKRLDSHLHNPHLSLDIAKTIASQATQAVQNIGFLLRPYLMTVNVVLTQDVFHTFPVEKATQKEEEEEESRCSICLEDLWTTKHMKLPQCLHRFHFRCICKWLVKRNSCPLCREIVFEENDV